MEMETAQLAERFRAMELSHKCDYTSYESSPKSWEVVSNFFSKFMYMSLNHVNYA